MQRTNSNRDSRDSGRSGGFNRNNSAPRAPVTLHDAVCDKCKQNCTVPFKPTPGKPVMCKDCFSKDRPQNNSRPRQGSFNSRGPSNDRPRESHAAVCDKCKKDCTVPFKPTQGKPVLCGDCFRNKN
ncbi:MAG: hypothetical protein PF542_02470 [Nanoarchaeota archaeon]|jgi:CxxC-x17-CxxC domain-containing protein|nr:hypothetical protein [Nanoarchaeota archaeon]